MSSEEVVRFYNSLEQERETFQLPLKDLLKSEIVVKDETGGEITGIAGVRRHKMLPVLFIVVKSRFQGKGIGKRLLERLHKIVKEKHSFIVLSVLKGNKPAVSLFRNSGYRIFVEKGNFYYMIYPIGIQGRILSKILTLFPLIGI